MVTDLVWPCLGEIVNLVGLRFAEDRLAGHPVEKGIHVCGHDCVRDILRGPQSNELEDGGGGTGD